MYNTRKCRLLLCNSGWSKYFPLDKLYISPETELAGGQGSSRVAVKFWPHSLWPVLLWSWQHGIVARNKGFSYYMELIYAHFMEYLLSIIFKYAYICWHYSIGWYVSIISSHNSVVCLEQYLYIIWLVRHKLQFWNIVS